MSWLSRWNSIDWVFLAVVISMLISLFLWWTRKSYFPTLDLCDLAHDRFHLSALERAGFPQDDKDALNRAVLHAEQRFWHRMAVALLSQVPSELTISGLFCALVWPVFVVLNVLLLAQIVGMQVSGGKVIDIHPFGSYAAIPLVTALLYALAQTVFGVMMGESDKKDLKRYVMLGLLLVAILLEGALAVYRAWLIAGANPEFHPDANMVDTFLSGRFGLVVGGIFGILFPAAHAALGYVGFPHFIRPIVRYLLNLAGGLSLLALAILNWALLAWHPVHPKDQRAQLNDERFNKALEEKTAEAVEQWKENELPKILEEARQKWVEEWESSAHPAAVPPGLSKDDDDYWKQQAILIERAAALSRELESLHVQLPIDLAQLSQTIQDADCLKTKWITLAGRCSHMVNQASMLDADQLAAEAASISALYNRAAVHPQADGDGHTGADLRLNGTANLPPLFRLARSHDKLNEAFQTLEQNRYSLWTEAKSLGEAILKRAAVFLTGFPELEQFVRNVQIDRPGFNQATTLALRRGELDSLNAEFARIPEPELGNPRSFDYRRLDLLRNRCNTLMNGLEATRLPSSVDLNTMKEKLGSIPRELIDAYRSALLSLQRAEGLARERLKRVEQKPAWYYRLGELLA